MDRLTKVAAFFLLIAIVGGFTVYALTQWTHTIPWDIPPSPTYTFQVYDLQGNIIADAGTSLTVTSSPYSESYNITNIGTGTIKIEKSEYKAGIGTVEWNVAFPLTLTAGQSVIATVTLTISQQGNYQFWLSSVAAP